MLPFGRCLYLWRLDRGLSQSELAVKAGLHRPNLSDIERGKREVSLRTLRALALALEIPPGTLADGTPPGGEPEGLSREALERIADAVISGGKFRDPGEKDLAERMALLLGPRLAAQGGGPSGIRRGKRSARSAWLSVGGTRPSSEVESLIRRIVEKGGALGPRGKGEAR